jgi:hypothetical protein
MIKIPTTTIEQGYFYSTKKNHTVLKKQEYGSTNRQKGALK